MRRINSNKFESILKSNYHIFYDEHFKVYVTEDFNGDFNFVNKYELVGIIIIELTKTFKFYDIDGVWIRILSTELTDTKLIDEVELLYNNI